METMLENLVLLMIVLGGAKVLIFHLLGKARNEMAATVIDNKTGKLVSIKPNKMDHYNYVYSQEEIYDSMYFEIQYKFKNYMQGGLLNNEQVKYVERYLRNELNDKGKYKNQAHAIYSMLKSPLLDNSVYSQLNTILEDFTHRK